MVFNLNTSYMAIYIHIIHPVLIIISIKALNELTHIRPRSLKLDLGIKHFPLLPLSSLVILGFQIVHDAKISSLGHVL